MHPPALYGVGTFYSYAPGNKRVWRGAIDNNSNTTLGEVTFWSVSGQKLATYNLAAGAAVYQNNAWRRRTGHLWQNRYFSCAVAAEKEEIAIRYVEWNPVRAGMAEMPQAYRWSSAAAHLTGRGAEKIPLLDWEYWESRGGASGWRLLLEELQDVRDVQRIRRATCAGAPLGSAAFVKDMEVRFGRHWRSPGRPRKGAGSEKGTEQAASVSVG